MNLFVKIFFVIFVSCLSFNKLHAQNINSWSSQFPLPELTAFLTLSEPSEQIEQLLNEEQNNNSALKALIYAVGIETAINPQTCGQWDTIPDKGYVWRLGIHAANALSLNLFIENYLMQPGMTLYAYDKSMNNIAGPFDSRNNANGGVLPIQSLPGDMIIVEWNIHINITSRNDFTITSVGYGFRDFSGFGRISLSSSDCNIDVNCLTGNNWQREKRAVVLMQTILPNRMTQYCTGALINQAVEFDRKQPYILTANHCISDPVLAQNTTFIFGCERAYCDGDDPILTGLPQITGSKLLATYRELDFALLELHENSLTAAHQPFYAGWNASSAAPRDVVGIHHPYRPFPQLSVKKISIASSTLTTSTFADPTTDFYCDQNAHWRIPRWDEGVTERGSSGSPIFDAEHRIVGTLSGGAATCASPVNDYYSKFSEQWNKYPDKEQSLMQWLDPDNTGVTSIFGYDPFTSYERQYNFLGNIAENETATLLKSEEWGYLTSLNDQRWVSFAEKIKNDSVANIIGMEAYVAKLSEPSVNVEFAVWSGKDFPVYTLYKKSFPVAADKIDNRIRFYFDDIIDVEGDFFIGYNLENSSPLDTFAVYHSMRPHPGISTMYVKESNGPWMALDEKVPPIYASMGIRAMGNFGKQTQEFQPPKEHNELKIIYQNNNDKILLLFDVEDPFVSLHTVTIECYDTSGKRLLMFNDVKGRMDIYSGKAYLQVELDVSILPSGMYIIQTFNNNKKQSGKFVKQR